MHILVALLLDGFSIADGTEGDRLTKEEIKLGCVRQQHLLQVNDL